VSTAGRSADKLFTVRLARLLSIDNPVGSTDVVLAPMTDEIQTLNVLDYITGRVLGKIEVEASQSDRLMHLPRIHGWRAWEALTTKEREGMGLESERAIMFTRS
jgi:hypothetical protein